MTKAAQQIENKINELLKKEETTDEEINELLLTICSNCNGEGEVISSYMPNNPNLIDVPYTRCPDCHGAGVK